MIGKMWKSSGLFDNKKRSVGLKRQNLLDLARGEYLVFIDDDDTISDDYVSEILKALYKNPAVDCVVFDIICTGYETTLYCKYGIEYEYQRFGNQWRGKPAHTMVYKSSIAKKHLFSDVVFEEDKDWVIRACMDIRNQVRINKVLYYYKYNPAISETPIINK